MTSACSILSGNKLLSAVAVVWDRSWAAVLTFCLALPLQSRWNLVSLWQIWSSPLSFSRISSRSVLPRRVPLSGKNKYNIFKRLVNASTHKPLSITFKYIIALLKHWWSHLMTIWLLNLACLVLDQQANFCVSCFRNNKMRMAKICLTFSAWYC